MSRRTAPCRFLRSSLIVVLAASAPKSGLAMHPHLEFDELVHTADIIFAGTVTATHSRWGPKGNTILTDVTFGDVKAIGQKAHVEADIARGVTLTFDGGQVGGVGLKVSGVPKFEAGQRVVLFALHDGRDYSNPLVGGPQSLFHVIKDETTGTERVLAAGRSAVVSAANGRLVLGPAVSRIRDGRIESVAAPANMAPDPVIVGGDGRGRAQRRKRPVVETTLTLDGFASEIRATLAGPPPAHPVLGDFRKDLPAGEATDLKTSVDGPGHPAIQAAMKSALSGDSTVQPPPLAVSSADSSASPASAGVPMSPIETGQSLGYCGYFDLPIVMEQVPTSWQSHDENDWAMIQWNQFMDVYRQRSDDGRFGSNYYSEFCGWLTEAKKRDAYGSGWGTAIAICYTWALWCDCCEIYEADIAFKTGPDWRYNMDEVLGQAGRVLYQPVVMHELGHSWGLQRGTGGELYDYDIPTVMHRAYNNVVENGNGIHYYDAYAIRRVYDDQTSVININDVGVESYYASGGLHNATTDKGAYTSGEPITISNITVENMSNSAAPNVDLKLYLSRYRNGRDWPISESVHWGSFPKESHWVGSITATIPVTVPTYSRYYITLEATANNGDVGWDDDRLNNTTSMYDPIAVTCPPIGPPTGLTASNGTYPNGVVLSWNAVAGAQSYSIYRSTTSDSSTAQLILSKSTNTSGVLDVQVVPGTTYFYWVTAISPCGSESAFSSLAMGYAALTSPFVTATRGDYHTHIHVTWPAATGATHYRLYRSDTYDLVGAMSITGWQTGLSYDDTPPTSAQDYFYWVKAAASSSGAHASALILERVGVGRLALPPPANVVATDDDATHPDWVTITWDSVPTATHYQVYRSMWDNSFTASAISAWQTSLSFDDLTATAGPIYYYWVKAGKNEYGVGATDFSEPDMGSRPAPPLPKPTGVAASDGTSPDHVTVSWSPVAGASHYRVWRGGTVWWFFSAPVSGWITGTSYNHTTGTPGHTYYYWVTAASDHLGSQESEHGGYNTGWRALSPPSTITAGNGTSSTEITVTWDQPLGASTYEVWRNTTNDSGTATAVSGWLTEPVYHDTAATQSTWYHYWLKAARSDNSRPSALSTATDSGWRALPSPQRVIASNGEYKDRVTVYWQGVTGAVAYRVYRSTTDDPATSQALSSLWQAGLSYNDKTAAIGQDYYYWVKAAGASNGQFPSSYSTSALGWRPLPAPTDLAASDGTWGASVRVTWNAVAGAAAYRVYSATVNNSASASPISDWITVTAFTDTTAVVGETRYYWVKAADDTSGGHASLFSSSDSGYRVLLPPAGVQASKGTYTGFVSISWNAVPNATHYQVFLDETPESVPVSGWLTDLTFNDTDNVPGVIRSYSVKAATGDQGENQSAESSTDSGWRGLPPPANVVATDGGYPDRVEINWDSVAYANYYRVHRHTGPIAINGIVVADWQVATAFTDASAAPDTVYYYWVQSDVDGTGQFASLFGIYDTGFAGADCNVNGVPDATEPDVDGDGRIDGCDNCPSQPNADQTDADADLVGDACDECPGTVPGAEVDAIGCPPVIAGDFDRDGDVDGNDWIHFEACATGPEVPRTEPQCADAGLDPGEDVDQADFAIFQRCFSGENVPGDPTCVE